MAVKQVTAPTRVQSTRQPVRLKSPPSVRRQPSRPPRGPTRVPTSRPTLTTSPSLRHRPIPQTFSQRVGKAVQDFGTTQYQRVRRGTRTVRPQVRMGTPVRPSVGWNPARSRAGTSLARRVIPQIDTPKPYGGYSGLSTGSISDWLYGSRR